MSSRPPGCCSRTRQAASPSGGAPEYQPRRHPVPWLGALSVGTSCHQHAENDAHHRCDAHHLPGIVAHVTVCLLGDLPRLTTHLSGAIAERALRGRNGNLHLGADPLDIGCRNVLDGPSQILDVVEEVVEIAIGGRFLGFSNLARVDLRVHESLLLGYSTG